MNGKMLVLVLLLSISSGCVCKEIAKSYDGFLASAGAEYITYVEKDPDLSEAQKRVRLNNYKAARELVNEELKKR
jgi:hypothetical protein